MKPEQGEIYIHEDPDLTFPKVDMVTNIRELNILLKPLKAAKEDRLGGAGFGWNLYPEKLFICGNGLDHEIVFVDPYAYPHLYKLAVKRWPGHLPHRNRYGYLNPKLVKLILDEMD